MSQLLRRQLRRPLALVVALLSLTLVLGTPASAGAAVRTPRHTVASNDQGNMKSYVYGTASHHRRVVGSFTPHHFFVGRDGHLKAGGKLNIVTRGPGRDVHRVQKGIVMDVRRYNVGGAFGSGSAAMPAAAATSCNILNLVLGPLDLNLLGLKVHLNRVVLDIVAVTGAGNLLGNLLCAVAGLLDGTGVLTQIAGLLQQILQLLNLAALPAP
jgi:hypothetical protein